MPTCSPFWPPARSYALALYGEHFRHITDKCEEDEEDVKDDILTCSHVQTFFLELLDEKSQSVLSHLPAQPFFSLGNSCLCVPLHRHLFVLSSLRSSARVENGPGSLMTHTCDRITSGIHALTGNYLVLGVKLKETVLLRLWLLNCGTLSYWT